MFFVKGLWALVWHCFGGPLGAPRVSRGPLLGPLACNPALGLTTDGVGFANQRFGVGKPTALGLRTDVRHDKTKAKRTDLEDKHKIRQPGAELNKS